MSDRARVANTVLWVFIALFVLMSATRLLHNPPLQPLRPFLSVAILMGIAIVHGVRRYGWRHFIIFFLFTFVISWSYETSVSLADSHSATITIPANLVPSFGLCRC